MDVVGSPVLCTLALLLPVNMPALISGRVGADAETSWAKRTVRDPTLLVETRGSGG